MPALTRLRADINHVPQPIMAEYYSQRASAGGLMVAEGTYISPMASGYPRAPGLFTEQQVAAWRPIVQGVHAKGGVFFNQIWHCGRASHPDLIGGRTPVGPSPIAAAGQIPLGDGRMADYPVPEPLDQGGIREVIAEYQMAARNAISAGFDGVEIHGASGYLIDQFIKSGTNTRTDAYGGCIENRCRFALEVVAAVVSEVGADCVGIRLSPFNNLMDELDRTPFATFTYLVEQLNTLQLAYVHMVEPRAQGNRPDNPAAFGTLEPFRKVWNGPFIVAGGYNADSGAAAIASGHTDLVAYGRLWIANPDLPQRFKSGAVLNKYNRATFYTHGTEGYIDYPFMQR